MVVEVFDLNDVKNETFQIHPEFDDYAFFHSSMYKEIFKTKKKNNKKYEDGYVKLINGKRVLYLKYHVLPTVKKNQMALSYTNFHAIKSEETAFQKIKIKKTCWFCFHAFNQRNDIKYSFWTAFLSVLAILCIEIPELILRLI